MRQHLVDQKRTGDNTNISSLAYEFDSKLIILISEISYNKICDSFLRNLAQNDDYVRLYEQIIRHFLDDAAKLPNVEFLGEVSQNRYI